MWLKRIAGHQYGALMRSGFILLISMWDSVAFAATSQELDAANRQLEIIQQQQRDILRQDIERTKPSRIEEGENLDKYRVGEPESKAGAECRQINEIAVDGGDLIDSSLLDSLRRDFVGRCLSAVDIEKILSLITNHYVERGYITTRAYLPPQDLRAGRLVILVIEGTIEELRKEGEDAKRLFLPGAFPTGSGDQLNLRDLEQGVEQINRLSSNNATMEILPGSLPGKSIVVIRNKSSFPVHANLAYDNMGNTSTGKESGFIGVTFDNMLGLNDSLLLSVRHSLPYDKEHYSFGRTADFSVPYGNYLFGINVSRNTYVNFLKLPSGAKLETSGRTDSEVFSIDRILVRTQRGRLSLATKLGAQQSYNYIGHELSETSSRKMSFMAVALKGGGSVFDGFLFGQLEYSRGLEIFDALIDSRVVSSDTPRAQYQKVNLDMSYSKSISPISFVSQVSAQYTNTPLYGYQQILIGSPATVRGFMDSSISGDRGYYMRNELRYPIQLAHVSSYAYVGYDFGQVWGIAQGAPEGGLSSVTWGLNAQWQRFNADVFLSRPCDMPSSMKGESASVWFRVSSSF